MSDTENTSNNIYEFTVSELSGALKRQVEDAFSYVRVRAEISGFKRAASGHLYMALKDDKAVMDGVMWRGMAGRLSFNPEDGLEVVCVGKLTTYPARSKYQMVIDHMEPAGAGALMALLEERKKKLAAQGLFDPERKKQRPFIPRVIGVVTSPTGAVIRDILHRLNDRFPRHVLVWPVQVQGTEAAAQVANAIKGFNQFGREGCGHTLPRPDLLIVARGGGSLEDLWSFNEEVVVRAAAESDIPLISAVGHETDTTLIDYAADLRAPTPTAAAEMAVPVKADLDYTVSDFARRLRDSKSRLFDAKEDRLKALARALPKPRDLLGLASQKLDDLSDRLPRGLMAVAQGNDVKLSGVAARLSASQLMKAMDYKKQNLDDLGERLPRGLMSVAKDNDVKLSRVASRLSANQIIRSMDHQGQGLTELWARLDRAQDANFRQFNEKFLSQVRLLDTLSYQSVLKRGFAVVRNDQGAPVKAVADMTLGDVLNIEMVDGQQSVVVGDEAAPKARPTPVPKPKAAPKKPKSKAGSENQGSLF